MTAWKDLERRVCRALGAERAGPRGKHGSDDDGAAPFSLEVKRQKRYSLSAKNLAQARRQGKADGRPWLLVMCEHGSPRPIAVLDFWVLAEMAQLAGMLPTPLEVDGESDEVAPEVLDGARWDPIEGSYRAADGAILPADKVLIHRLITKRGESDE